MKTIFPWESRDEDEIGAEAKAAVIF